jgi:predicted AAA+ superfamily ATPase
MKYLERITDKELQRKLNASGALLIRGCKACGKTESASQFAKSVLEVDIDENVPYLMETAPKLLLEGATPRLIDEWQEQPKLWNMVRHEVDKRQSPAQFILTGSANPDEKVKKHSGAGRFTTLDMRTLSWQELGHSSGKISLEKLLAGEKFDADSEHAELEFIIEKIIIGGYPSLIGKTISDANDINRSYINLLAEVDMSRVSEVKRDPQKVRNLLRSLARNTATTIETSSLEKDIFEKDSFSITRPTIYNYLDALERLMIIENQPAWNTHLRSSAMLRKAPKRHLSDVSLAVATLGATEKTLLKDLKFTGFLFESLVTHDLRVYAQANDASVFHYRDSTNLEVDAIVQKYSGEWAAFEVKLGTGQIDDAAENLKKFASILDTNRIQAPQSLNIITGTGMSYSRKDGVNVISLASLGS